jgi:hypothetical protein
MPAATLLDGHSNALTRKDHGEAVEDHVSTRKWQHTQLVPVKTLALSNVRIVALATPIATIRIAAEFLLPYCRQYGHFDQGSMKLPDCR